jgi:peptidoglycan/LPS O-acetylase OafA/YrhL
MAGTRTRIPALDGLRGIAIALVLVYHAHTFGGGIDSSQPLVRAAAVGWVGVDLFFVLSGFLITSILLDKPAQRSNFAAFFSRRVRRIFPLYYVTLFGYFVVIGHFRTLPDASDAPWYLAYVSNLRILKTGFYWWSPVNQFWSLAIEEQFYLVWPFVVLGRSRRTVVRVCLGVIVVSLATRVGLLTLHHAPWIYTLTPCRADAIAFGALAAVYVREGRPAPPAAVVAIGSGVVWLGVAVYLRGVYWTDVPLVDWVGLPAFAIAGAATIAYVATVPDDARVARALSIAPLRSLGRYSYGIYIFQQGAMLAASAKLRPHLGGMSAVVTVPLIGGAASILAYVMAFASWHLLERRFLDGPRSSSASVPASSSVES